MLPLLNAILPTVVSYHPFTGVMTLRRRPGLITLYPSQVMITQVADVEEGLALLAVMRDLINQTWARRNEIQPRHEGRPCRGRWMCTSCYRAPTVGPAASRPAWRLRLAFWRAAIRPEQCPSLADPAFVAQRQALADMLSDTAETTGRPNLNAL